MITLPDAIVVDASIAMKWYLNDEADVETAIEVLNAFLRGEVVFIAPDHIRYEVANALWQATRSGRIEDRFGRSSLDECLVCSIPSVADNLLIVDAYEFAVLFGCALYDGLYLALATRESVPLVHADRRLRNVLGGRFDLELWIGDL